MGVCHVCMLGAAGAHKDAWERHASDLRHELPQLVVIRLANRARGVGGGGGRGGPAMFVVVGMSTTDTASGLRPLIPGVSVFTKSGPGPIHGTRPS